ncbi:hypothetical protein QQP08_022130 [Theobroma cacao]|nr:hypothetical protein QQP08_022130 [Theobroma cacao]
MDCKKLAFLFAATALLLVAAMTPTAFAARNGVVPFFLDTNVAAYIRHPFSNIFMPSKSGKTASLPVASACLIPWIAVAIADACILWESAMGRAAKGSAVHSPSQDGSVHVF